MQITSEMLDDFEEALRTSSYRKAKELAEDAGVSEAWLSNFRKGGSGSTDRWRLEPVLQHVGLDIDSYQPPSGQPWMLPENLDGVSDEDRAVVNEFISWVFEVRSRSA